MLWLTNSMVLPPGTDLAEFFEAFFLKLGVAHGEDLVDEQDFGLHVRRDCKRQAHVHAAGVALDRRVNEFLHLGEGDDFVELARDLGSPHAEDGAVQEDVFAPGQFGMEAGADLEELSRRGPRCRHGRGSAR